MKGMCGTQFGESLICSCDFAVLCLSFTSTCIVTEDFLLPRLAAPLTDEQKLELDVERRLLNEWPKEKRKTYRANQELVRKKVFESRFLLLR